MADVSFYNLGALGIVKDVPSHLLPPEAWSDGNNMRMVDGFAKRFTGHEQVFGTPNVAPGFVFYVPATGDNFWLYANLTSAHVYDGTNHTDITRSAGASPYTAVNLRDWNGCILGGVPILNNGADVPQYWPVLNPGTDLANLTAWPATLRAKIMRNFGRFLVALNLNDNGTLLQHAIQWSHPADPGSVPSSWAHADPAVDAGRTHLTDIQGGQILDAYLLGNYLVIYKERSTHLMRFVGQPDIMGFELLLNSGLMAPRCCAVIDNGVKHFCVTEDDVVVHAGTRSVDYPLDKKDRRYLFNDMDVTNRVNAFAFDNPVNEEAWFAYPASGATFPNKALVYNYRTGVPKFRDFAGLSMDVGTVPTVAAGSWDSDPGAWDADPSPWNLPGNRRIVVSDPSASKFWSYDTGLSFGGATVTSFLQRTGLAIIGKDRQGQPKADFQSNKVFTRIWPKITGSAVVQVRLGVQDEIGGGITWSPYQTYSASVKYLDLDPPLQGRFGAVEFLSLSDADWQVEGYDLELEVVSEL